VTDIGPRERIEDKAYRLSSFDQFDFVGKTVLDIGGCEGAPAKVALERGAKSAIVLDNETWKNYKGQWSWGGYPYEGVKYVKGYWQDWTEQADIVIAGNIFYHVTRPWEFLIKLRNLAKEGIIFWTRILVDSQDAIWRITDGTTEVTDDEMVIWDCSEKGLQYMLDVCGLRYERIGRFEHTLHLVMYPNY
jgi:hypothetical protein